MHFAITLYAYYILYKISEKLSKEEIKMGPLIKHLMDEHVVITKHLLELKNTLLVKAVWTESDWNHLQQKATFLGNYVEKRHHFIEEEILFPAMDASGLIGQGGPHCGYFFQIHMTEDQLRESNKIISENTLQIPEYKISPFIKSIYDKRSALCIPMDEHLAGHNLMGIVKSAVPAKNIALAKKALADYIHLIELHIDKEDRCLFVRAEDLLSVELQQSLMPKVQEVVEQIKS